MRYKKFVLSAPVALLALLAGCVSLGPDFESPEWDGPKAWSATNAPVASPLPDGAPWWSVFNDPVLDTLETLLLEQNPSLASAVACLDAYAAQLGIARAGYAPSIGLSGAAVYDRQTGEAHGSGAKIPDHPAWLFKPGAFLSWELDFWGRVRRNVEAASADFAAAEQNVRDARRLLAANLASSYLSLRTLQARLDYARRNAKLQADTLELVRTRRETGLSGDLDLRQAEMNLAATRASIPSLEAQIDAQNYSIGPSVEWPIFTAGRLRNQVRAYEASARAAEADFRKAVLSAAAECETALSARRAAFAVLDDLRAAVTAAEQAVDLSDSLYRTGLTDFQNVLDMQRQLASNQDALAQGIGFAASALVDVWKAFAGPDKGGHWEVVK